LQFFISEWEEAARNARRQARSRGESFTGSKAVNFIERVGQSKYTFGVAVQSNVIDLGKAAAGLLAKRRRQDFLRASSRSYSRGVHSMLTGVA